MIIELIQEEIHQNFPKKDNFDLSVIDKYIIHCSPIFSKKLYECFLEKGFLISVNDYNVIEKPKFVKYQIPYIGILEVIDDLYQGYTIEKIGL